MSLFDYVLIGIVGFSSVLSLWRGFMREIISIVGIIAAFFLASRQSHHVADFLSQWIDNDALLQPVAFFIVFIMVAFLTGLLHRIAFIAGLLDVTNLNRALGVVFGFVRGIIFIGIGFMLYTSYADMNAAWLKESRLAPHGIELSKKMRELIPEGMPLSSSGQYDILEFFGHTSDKLESFIDDNLSHSNIKLSSDTLDNAVQELEQRKPQTTSASPTNKDAKP